MSYSSRSAKRLAFVLCSCGILSVSLPVPLGSLSFCLLLLFFFAHPVHQFAFRAISCFRSPSLFIANTPRVYILRR